MGNNVFERDYACVYDLIYKNKKYENEIKKILSFLKLNNINKNSKFIDVGCGTGNHLIELLKLGYNNVVGIDKSSEMLEIAKKKISKFKRLEKILFNKEIEEIKFDEKFDVMLCLFNVIGYIGNIDKTLESFSSHLKKKAFLIFDFWNGHAVLKNKPSRTVNVSNKQSLCIKKNSTGKIIEGNKVEVNIEFSLKKKKKLVLQNKEIHNVSFFFPNELEQLLSKKGFDTIKITDFYGNLLDSNNDDWKAICYAKKKD